MKQEGQSSGPATPRPWQLHYRIVKSRIALQKCGKLELNFTSNIDAMALAEHVCNLLGEMRPWCSEGAASPANWLLLASLICYNAGHRARLAAASAVTDRAASSPPFPLPAIPLRLRPVAGDRETTRRFCDTFRFPATQQLILVYGHGWSTWSLARVTRPQTPQTPQTYKLHRGSTQSRSPLHPRSKFTPFSLSSQELFIPEEGNRG